jgi:hypothetical protein
MSLRQFEALWHAANADMGLDAEVIHAEGNR